MSLDEILTAFKSGDIDLDNARTQIRGSFFQDLGHSTLDNDRVLRTGAAEVIYGEHKTPNQIVELVQAMARADQNALVTRTTHPVFELVREQFADAEYHELARAITLRQHEPDEVDSMIA
ncbi:MAG: 1-(5-phosphoribosyl)-5-amino-4-imidazole-carboxylate carboxylase, partial [Gammaproteobacteria bacterium]|nr:1-(5-phosphoribosyl)-5-amino-4-imidazole-carboxylate carboxylase [Gammaproteobacteria bacterium]